MSLFFGNLTEAFVVFGSAAQAASQGNAAAAAQLPSAANNFRHKAATNASYLVYIGTRV